MLNYRKGKPSYCLALWLFFIPSLYQFIIQSEVFAFYQLVIQSSVGQFNLMLNKLN